MLLFPNISAITIGVLALYIVASLFGYNFFTTFFRKDTSAYAYLAVGAIGLGSVVFYTGIVFGAWDFNPFDAVSYWNVVLGLAFLILGIVFLITDQIPLGFLFLFVVGSYIANYKDESILRSFIDPVVFIVFLVIMLFSWITSDKEKKVKLKNDIEKREKAIEEYRKAYGGELPKEYESRIYDIIDEAQKRGKAQLEKIESKEK